MKLISKLITIVILISLIVLFTYNVYATDDYNVIYANSSLTWICHENKDPEKIFQKLSYEELEERNIKIKH